MKITKGCLSIGKLEQKLNTNIDDKTSKKLKFKITLIKEEEAE